MPSRPRIEIDGLDYNLSNMGETSFALKADSFQVRKKKLGFFRVALAQEALLQNVDISIYGNNNFARNDNLANEQMKSLDFPLFPAGANFINFFHTKRLSGLVMSPVRISFYDSAHAPSHLTSSTAFLHFKKQAVVFKGNVQMICGTQILRTNQLTLFPQESKIKVDEYFTLKTNKSETSGSNLVSDVFLKFISL